MSKNLALRSAEPGDDRTADAGHAPGTSHAHETAAATPGVSLKSLAARGALWTGMGYGGAQVLRFGGNLILTRILFEEAFGLMMLVNTFLQGLQLFSDIGIGPSIIQSSRGDDRRFLDTAWTMQVVRGFALFALATLAATPIAAFYGQPALATLLPVAAVAMVLAGLNSTKLFTQNRKLAMGRLTLVEVASQLVGLVVMITWALIERSVWAIVAGGVAVAFTKMVASHVALPGVSNRPCWDRSAARAVFGFGKWIFLSTVLTFLAGQSDRLIFGKLVPLGLLGVYAVAVMVATMPPMAIGHGALSIAFPIYSRVLNAGKDIVPIFRRVRWATLVGGGWMLSGLIAGGPAAIALLYDPRYVEAGWIVRTLSIGGWFFVLEASNGAALLALGRANWVAAANGGKLVGLLILIPLGYALGGFPGAVLGFAAAELFKYAVSAWAAVRAQLPGRRQDILMTLAVAISSCAGAFAAHTAAAAGRSAALQAALVFTVVTVVWIPFGLDVLRRYRAVGAREAR